MSTEPSGPGEETPLSGEQAARRRHRVSALAVAGAVLVAGGGGAWWTSTAGESTRSDAKPPKLALDGLSSAGHRGEDPGIAPGEPHPQVYRAAAKLPRGPESAPVYRSPASVSRKPVAKLARALDVNGKPEKKGGRWVVGESPAALTVNDDRLSGNWTYRSGNWPAMPCGKPLPTVPQQGFAPPEPCPAVPGSGKGDPVSEEKAKKAVRPVLRALKLPGAGLDADVTAGSLRMVTVTPEVGGMKAKDWNSTFTVNEDGRVVRGHGNLGPLRKGASYPVMSAKETLKHLNRQGPRGAATVQEPWAGDTRSGASGTPEGPPAGPKAGPRKPLKVTGAEFGLVTRYTDGKPVLVPAWTYRVRVAGEHTARIAHPAVEPAFLEPARPSQPARPAPPTTDGDSGTASPPDAGTGRPEKPEAGAPAAGQAVNSYETDGRKLKLSFWGGVCSGYTAVAKESDDEVEVSVRQKNAERGEVCVKMARLQTVEVELDEELGDRRVVDAADGEGLPRK